MQQKTRVLVLDSDPEVCNIVGEKMANHEYEVVSLSKVDAALDLIKNSHVDVLIAGSTIDNVSGLEVAIEIRKTHSLKPEIVLLSDKPSPQELSDAHQAGICYIAKKPFNYQEICAVLDRFVLKQDKRRYENVPINPQVLSELYGYVWMLNKKIEFDTDVSNLGRGGFFYKMHPENKHPLDIGQIIKFNLRMGMVPNCFIQGVGIVRWTDDHPDNRGAGVEFLSMTADSENIVNAFVSLFKVQSFVPHT